MDISSATNHSFQKKIVALSSEDRRVISRLYSANLSKATNKPVYIKSNTGLDFGNIRTTEERILALEDLLSNNDLYYDTQDSAGRGLTSKGAYAKDFYDSFNQINHHFSSFADVIPYYLQAAERLLQVESHVLSVSIYIAIKDSIRDGSEPLTSSESISIVLNSLSTCADYVKDAPIPYSRYLSLQKVLVNICKKKDIYLVEEPSDTTVFHALPPQPIYQITENTTLTLSHQSLRDHAAYKAYIFKVFGMND
ncbi:hypothetical protein HOH87_01700 [bacterium]|jgi:hypothetical protein|nr:hypothetical protein [bacterium]